MRPSCQSQMVCLGKPHGICASHRSATVQGMGELNEIGTCKQCLFVHIGWEGHTVRSICEYYYILCDTFARISNDGLLVERSGATSCGCDEFGKLEKRYLLCR